MQSFVALLRGINVGKSRRVSMADLRRLLLGLGYADVVTLLNSGNAVFRAPRRKSARYAADISTAISSRLRIEVPVIVKSASELATIISENPIEAAVEEHSRLLVAFVQEPSALSAVAAVGKLVIPPEQFALGTAAAYLLCPKGVVESKAWSALLGSKGCLATTRNWATVLKLHALTAAE